MDLGAFEPLIADLLKKSSSRDPRLVRLSSVTAAIVHVINNEGLEVKAPRVYTTAVVTLEGTLPKKYAGMNQFLDTVNTQIALLQLMHLVLPLLDKSIVNASFVPVGRVIRNLMDLIGSTVMARQEANLKDETDCIATLLSTAGKTSSTLIRCISNPPIYVDEKVVRTFFRDTLLALLKGGSQRVCKAARYSIGDLLSMDNPKCHACVVEDVNSFLASSLEMISTARDPAQMCREMTWALDLVRSNFMFLDSSVAQQLLQVLVSLVDQHNTGSEDFVLNTRDSSSVVLAMNSVLSAVTNLLDCEVDEDRVNDFSGKAMATFLQVEPRHILCAANLETRYAGCDLLAQAILVCARRLIFADAAKAAVLLPLSIHRLFSLANDHWKSDTASPVASKWFFQLSQIIRVHLAAMKAKDSAAHAKCCEASFHVAYQVVGTKEQCASQGAVICLAELILQVDPRVEIVKKTVKAMIYRRDTAGTLSASTAALEDAIFRVIQGLGIEQFWRLVDFPRLCTEKKYANCSWLLKLMRLAGPPMGTGCKSLLFFQSEILPLGLEFDAVGATEDMDINEQRENLVQLWSLLQCFCVRPNDITVAVPKISPILVQAMKDKRNPQLLISISTGIDVLARSVSAKVAGVQPLEHLELDECRPDVKTMERFSECMLPTLFKLVDDLFCAPSTQSQLMHLGYDSVGEDMRSSQAHALTSAIASLAKLAPREVVQNRLFTKLVHRLLDASQAPEDLSHKMCSLLALSQALYTSGCLDDLSVTLLYRALRPLVGTDDTRPRVQKRAYKLLAELCNSKTFISGEGRLRELVDLLTSSTSASQIASRSMRLRCVARIANSLKGSPELEQWLLASLLGEILLCLKDSKNKTREAAAHLLISVSRDVDIIVLIRAIAAAVASETSHMRSAAVTALSKVILEHGKSDERVLNLIPSLLHTVMLLSVDPSREVSKSMIVFLRVAISVCTPDMIRTMLPAILESLLSYHKGKDRFRGKVKITMKKLVRLFSVDDLLPLVADGESHIVNYIRKLAKEVTKANGSRNEHYREKSVDEMMASDEEDSDAEDSDAESKLPTVGRCHGLQDDRRRRVYHETEDSIRRNECHVLIRNDDQSGFDVKDLAANVVDDTNDSDSDDGECIAFDDRGRLVIKQKSNDACQKPENFIPRATSSSKTRKSEHVANGDHKQRGKKIGDAYTSTKAGGDVRRKGQLFDPFAYVPLEGKSYTKKNRRYAVKELDRLVGGRKRQKR